IPWLLFCPPCSYRATTTSSNQRRQLLRREVWTCLAGELDSNFHLYLDLACSARRFRDDDFPGHGLKTVLRGLAVMASWCGFGKLKWAADVRSNSADLPSFVANLEKNLRTWAAISKKNSVACD